MNDTKSEYKQQAKTLRPASDFHTASGRSRPAVSVLQGKTGNSVTQLYSKHLFGKLSGGKQLLLAPDDRLFASGAKIEQANGINGSIGFKAGETSEAIDDLKEVHAFVKSGSQLESDIEGYDQEDELKDLKSNSLKRLPDLESLQEKYKDIILDHLREGEKLPEDVASRVGQTNLKVREERIKFISELAETSLIYINEVEKPALEKRLDDYIEKQVVQKDRPLMPSDCRAMASYVAGFDAGSEGVDVTGSKVEAGDVYEYTSSNLEKAEWPFHYAAVIMTDGADHVTMENAAAKASDKFSKALYDRSWFYQLFGSEKGQTFDDHYKSMLDPE